MKRKFLGILLTTLFFSHNSISADLNKEEMMKRLTRGLTSTKNAKPNIDTEALSENLLAAMEVMNDPKLIKANARYMKKLYDALIDEGFTQEQALRLVSNQITLAN